MATHPLGLDPHRSHVMGVLNATPDSFSDGGLHDTVESAVRAADAMVAAGVSILDVGGESTRPRGAAYGDGSHILSAEAEIERVAPIVEALAQRFDCPISIDTSKAAVARAALDAGATWVNDVRALRGDPSLAGLVAQRGCPVVLMHMRGEPQNTFEFSNFGDVLTDVARELAERVRAARAAGVAADRIVLDPGLGFGKRADQNYELLSRLPELLALGCPLLVGPSRKAFIGEALGGRPPTERDWGTAAAVASAVLAGAWIVRVHNGAAMCDVVRVADSIRRGRPVGATA